MNTDIIVRDDSRIKLLTYVLALTGYPLKEQQRRAHKVHPILSDTLDKLDSYKNLSAVKYVRDNFNEIPLYFFYAYVVSLNSDFECLQFPDYLYEYVPELIKSDFNVYLKEFYETTNIEELWASHKVYWEDTCKDAQECFKGVFYKELLSKFFGDFKEDLVFYPNILVPQLMSSGASSNKELYCIARMPGPVGPSEELMKFSDDVLWVNIVSFHEFCHPLLDYVLRNNQEQLQKSKEIAKKVAVFSEYSDHYPNWEDLFAELLIYGMTIVFLRHYFSKEAADKFTTDSEIRTNIKLYKDVADILEEYLDGYDQGKYQNISDYFSVLINKLIKR